MDLGEVGSASDAGGVGGQRYFGDGLFSQFISLKLGSNNSSHLVTDNFDLLVELL